MTRQGLILIASVFLFSTAITALADDVPNIKEGLYEITMQGEMPEMPGMPKELMEKMAKSFPADKHKECITKEDFIPAGQSGTQQKCTFNSKSVTGNSVSWDAVCKTSQGNTYSQGQMTYQYKSFEGSIQIKNEAMEMKTKVSGVYIGKCK